MIAPAATVSCLQAACKAPALLPQALTLLSHNNLVMPADWQLTISRVVLVDVQLDPPTGTSSSSSKGPIGPSLWPLNAFSSVGTDLVLQDVRLVVPSPTLFAQYLDFFSQQPVLKSSTNTTIQTVRRAFASWQRGFNLSPSRRHVKGTHASAVTGGPDVVVQPARLSCRMCVSDERARLGR
jgi:hypothetical protein